MSIIYSKVFYHNLTQIMYFHELINLSNQKNSRFKPHPEPWFLESGERYLTIIPFKSSGKSSRQLAIVVCKV